MDPKTGGLALTPEQIETIFTYHEPVTDQLARYNALQKKAYVLATEINNLCPESREKTMAITTLQQVTFWANASIAVHETAAGGKQQRVG